MLNFIKSSQHLEFDFIGVKMIKGTVNFYYPDTINIPENEAERLKLAQNLVKLIRITKVNYESGSTNREFSSNFDFDIINSPRIARTSESSSFSFILIFGFLTYFSNPVIS